jgi:hypothetical protein
MIILKDVIWTIIGNFSYKKITWRWASVIDRLNAKKYNGIKKRKWNETQIIIGRDQ